MNTPKRPPSLTRLVDQVLSAYPRIYLACHVDHVRRQSDAAQLSSRDASILAHLADDALMDAAHLARHLRIAPSSLSATLKHLEALDYLQCKTSEADKRRHNFTITAKGRKALRAQSVLDAERVHALLASLDAGERVAAVHGLSVLAAAAARLESTPSAKRKRSES
jgi:DNA-binding MarR family transcriptional regulator